MRKISQLICLIVFLVLMATTCMARTVVNQAGVDDRLHHFINKRSACSSDTCVAAYCTGSYSAVYFTITNGNEFHFSNCVDACNHYCNSRK